MSLWHCGGGEGDLSDANFPMCAGKLRHCPDALKSEGDGNMFWVSEILDVDR